MGPDVVIIKGSAFGLAVILTGPLEVILKGVPDTTTKSWHKFSAYETFPLKLHVHPSGTERLPSVTHNHWVGLHNNNILQNILEINRLVANSFLLLRGE